MKSSSCHFQWRVICGIFSRHHYVLGTEHVLPVLFIQCTSIIHEPCLISIGSRDTHNSYDGDAHSKLTSQISMLLRSFIVTALSCVRKDGPTILRLSSSLPNYSFYNLPWSRCQLCWRACAINQEATIFPVPPWYCMTMSSCSGPPCVREPAETSPAHAAEIPILQL